MTISVFSILAALLITLLHFGENLGYQEYLETLFGRLKTRSAIENKLLMILENILLTHGSSLILILGLFFFGKKNHLLSFPFYFIITINTFPLIENIILSSHTAYYTYSLLKWVVPISLLSIVYYSTYKVSQRLSTISLLVLSINFILINGPGLEDFLRDTQENPSKIIAKIVKDDELLMVDRLFGHLVYYTGRHFIPECTTKACVDNELKKRGFSKAKILFSKKVGLSEYKEKYPTPFREVAFFYRWGFHNGIVTHFIQYRTKGHFGQYQTLLSLKSINKNSNSLFLAKTELNENLVSQTKSIKYKSHYLRVKNYKIHKDNIELVIQKTGNFDLSVLNYPEIIKLNYY